MSMVQSTHTPAYQPTLSCESLSALRGGIILYEQVGFSLCEGAVLVIHGGNGLGKTTLLKQLGGFLPLPRHSGSIRWFDRPVHSVQDYEQDMLYLGDKNGLYPDCTVEEQLTYIARSGGEIMRIPAAITYLGLQPYLPFRIRELSAGWKRRVALSRLLLVPSLLWLLDEPMIHLDAQGMYLLAGMIHSHAEKGGVTIMTSPHMDTSQPFYNIRIMVLNLADFTMINPTTEKEELCS